MILVFDLDDTLYDELTYVKSGFMAVAEYLSKKYSVPEETAYNIMTKKLEQYGRGQIFDYALKELGFYSKSNVKRCISVYRSHKPNISLFKEAQDCLMRFQGYPIYIVTDGNKLVQKNKLIALGVYNKVKHCFITHCYGIKNAKPSPYCFFKICSKEKVSPNKVFYIGDNPNKDFVGIKPWGFRTIRVLTGQYKNINVPSEFEAENKISSLTELTVEYINYLICNERGYK